MLTDSLYRPQHRDAFNGYSVRNNWDHFSFHPFIIVPVGNAWKAWQTLRISQTDGIMSIVRTSEKVILERRRCREDTVAARLKPNGPRVVHILKSAAAREVSDVTLSG